MRMQLCDCERVLLEEIGNRKMKRKDVAQTYALALRSREFDSIDWKKVNGAIIERWSTFALLWIKERAFSGKCFEAAPPPKEDGENE